MKRFDCGDFERRIHEILDQRGSLVNDVRLSRHRRRCGRCNQLFEEYTRLVELVRPSCAFPPAKKPPAKKPPAKKPPARNSSATGRPSRFGVWTTAASILILLVGIANAGRFGSPRSREYAHRNPPSDPRTTDLQTAEVANSMTAPDPTQIHRTQDIAEHAQQFLATIEGLPASLGGLEPYCVYTASLTGVTTLAAPVSLTMDMLRRHWSNPRRPEPPIRSDRMEPFLRNLRQV